MKKIDLHTHSNYSDGSLSPKELVKLAKESGVSAIALTDHDTADGIDEAICAGGELNIEVVPGIELVAECQNEEIHILGYFIEHNGQAFIEALKGFKQIRENRNERLIKRLGALGFYFGDGDLTADGKTLTRSHFARAMAARGYTKTPEQAFERYLNAGQPAFVGRNAPGAAEVIAVIKAASGVSVLAHPYSYKWKGGEVSQVIEKLQGDGLDGIEALYPTHTAAQTAALIKTAEHLGLKITGGSDYHGEHRAVKLGEGNIGYQVLERLKG